ncbi:MAG: hypothetical protein ACR2QU_01875 [Gammaproteobacteria bacterium]
MAFDRQLVSNGNPMEKIVGFSRAIRVGPFVSVGGTAPVVADGKTVGVDDVGVQARQCLEIINQRSRPQAPDWKTLCARVSF